MAVIRKQSGPAGLCKATISRQSTQIILPVTRQDFSQVSTKCVFSRAYEMNTSVVQASVKVAAGEKASRAPDIPIRLRRTAHSGGKNYVRSLSAG
jgi:hypothetical protein